MTSEPGGTASDVFICISKVFEAHCTDDDSDMDTDTDLITSDLHIACKIFTLEVTAGLIVDH